jgi:ankyrin repeat protein
MKRINEIVDADIDIDNRQRREIISQCLDKAICQLNNSYCLFQENNRHGVIGSSICFPKNNNSNTSKSNNNNNNNKGNNGKPHDVETRIALTLFHQWKRDAVTRIKNHKNTISHITNINSNDSNCKIKSSSSSSSSSNKSTTATPNEAAADYVQPPNPSSIVTIISDLGLSRDLSSPRQLADLICPILEEEFRNNPQWEIAPDIRSQSSGILSMITMKRSQLLRQAGRLPCPFCIQWCKGEKGLWWHQQQYHLVVHSQAAAVAQATIINLDAIILYGDKNYFSSALVVGDNNKPNTITTTYNNNNNNNNNNLHLPSDPIECIRQGDLDGLKRAIIENHGYEPSTMFDTKGATPLMWAAGGGHLDITRYLIEYCKCDPSQSQRGKRSFAGRTALHWAARNGHLDVVRYLLTSASCSSGSHTTISCGSDCKNLEPSKEATTPTTIKNKLLEAKTQDGTTAFGWASWQRHINVMEFLYESGCDIHVLNSFGCSPVLWCSQGTNGDGLLALQWLRNMGCNMRLVNHNGHGVLHKAAQRGQRNVAEWFVREECTGIKNAMTTSSIDATTGGNTITTTTISTTTTTERDTLLALIGPDIEGYCPSDLAGMDGHSNNEEFAKWLAMIEVQICQNLNCVPMYEIPKEYSYSDNIKSNSNSNNNKNSWEQYGGLRRIRSALKS